MRSIDRDVSGHLKKGHRAKGTSAIAAAVKHFTFCFAFKIIGPQPAGWYAVGCVVVHALVNPAERVPAQGHWLGR